MTARTCICLCLLLLVISLSPLAWGQTAPGQTLSITNSSTTRITFSLIVNGRPSQEVLDANVTRQYTTTQAYQVSLPTAGKPPMQYTLLPPNKYTIQWDDKQQRWIIVTTGRFY